MTRAMFAQVLLNLDGGSPSFTTSSFDDVSTTAWYFAAVEWAAQQGVVLGVGEGTFDPGRPITREQMAVMLYRFVNAMEIELPQVETAAFTDQASISVWAVDAVRAIQAAGIIVGRPDGSFDPQTTATRAEVATIFARFLDLIDTE